MKPRLITDKPDSGLAKALARFESQFNYPLGSGGRFCISHGEDYTRFYRSLGEAACIVVERESEVLGVIALVMRELLTPDGCRVPTAYIGDLKISPTCPRRGRVLMELAQAAREWVGDRADAAFGVVMGGSDATPEGYTGRLGIPAFESVGEIAILRIPYQQKGDARNSKFSVPEAEGIETFAKWSQGRYACIDGSPSERSVMCPLWFGDQSGRACGRLEDTRRAKQLFDMQGRELTSAHLSCLAFENFDAACRVVRATSSAAADLGFSHLFVAVPEPVAGKFVSTLAVGNIQHASATVYGVGVSPGLWNLNTAEI